MFIIIIAALIIITACILIVGPSNIMANRAETHRTYKQWENTYRAEKKYYKLFGRKKKDGQADGQNHPEC